MRMTTLQNYYENEIDHNCDYLSPVHGIKEAFKNLIEFTNK